MPNFIEIVKHFHFEGSFLSASPCGLGHINDTYAVVFSKQDGTWHSYILQRINHQVFKNPRGLMNNIQLITHYLRQKIVEKGGDPNREGLTLVETIDGDILYITPAGEYWRAYTFIEGALTYQIPENSAHIFHAGLAFGNFLRLLDGFPLESLHETIPNFHDTRRRYQAFLRAVESDALGRGKLAQEEIDFVLQRAGDTSVLVDALEAGELPQRVTHNDTKFNNVMIDDETGEGICVIDLDTVMPGLSLYDFGDAIRSITNTAAEDEKDLSNVRFSMERYERFTEGYLRAANGCMIQRELELLPFSAKLMTLECGMRFLTDFLNGDVYFKVHRNGHNLDRCRTQFKLVQEMEAQMDQMASVVARN